MSERLKKDNFDEKVFQDNQVSLIEFYSDSCVPCKRMAVVLADLEEAYPDKLFVGKVNVAYEQELTEKYEVTSTPTFLLVKNGEIISKLSGIQKKADLEEMINS